ncbi:hypothetical protein BT69DRAFT_1355177 [Atractiella rhizophila]|nr:hypothetical protein BT69DRAFT_1355177 [Atractiella rhizophila]
MTSTSIFILPFSHSALLMRLDVVSDVVLPENHRTSIAPNPTPQLPAIPCLKLYSLCRVIPNKMPLLSARTYVADAPALRRRYSASELSSAPATSYYRDHGTSHRINQLEQQKDILEHAIKLEKLEIERREELQRERMRQWEKERNFERKRNQLQRQRSSSHGSYGSGLDYPYNYYVSPSSTYSQSSSSRMRRPSMPSLPSSELVARSRSSRYSLSNQLSGFHLSSRTNVPAGYRLSANLGQVRTGMEDSLYSPDEARQILLEKLARVGRERGANGIIGVRVGRVGREIWATGDAVVFGRY